MAGISDRVQGFLSNWPQVKKQLEILTSNAEIALPEEEGEGFLHG